MIDMMRRMYVHVRNEFSHLAWSVRDEIANITCERAKKNGELEGSAAMNIEIGGNMTDASKAINCIQTLGQMPSNTRLMDKVFIDMCKDFDLVSGRDPQVFLHNLLDDLVFTGGCADVIITVIEMSVTKETVEQAHNRRLLRAVSR